VIKPAQRDDPRALAASRTGWTLDALSHAWRREYGVAPTVGVLSDTLKRLKITRKKSAASPPNGTRPSAQPSARP
jgi:transposase